MFPGNLLRARSRRSLGDEPLELHAFESFGPHFRVFRTLIPELFCGGVFFTGPSTRSQSSQGLSRSPQNS